MFTKEFYFDLVLKDNTVLFCKVIISHPKCIDGFGKSEWKAFILPVLVPVFPEYDKIRRVLSTRELIDDDSTIDKIYNILGQTSKPRYILQQ